MKRPSYHWIARSTSDYQMVSVVQNFPGDVLNVMVVDLLHQTVNTSERYMPSEEGWLHIKKKYLEELDFEEILYETVYAWGANPQVSKYELELHDTIQLGCAEWHWQDSDHSLHPPEKLGERMHHRWPSMGLE